MKLVKAALLGASGYTGADLLRLGINHPNLKFVELTANTHAGKAMGEVFPHLSNANLPDLVTNDEVNWSEIDVVFCGLPHGTSQKIIQKILSISPKTRIIDMSADYRLTDIELYQQTYGDEHIAPKLQKKAAYGLSEHNREAIKTAPIIACPGCYPTATLLALLPLLKSGVISSDDIIIDAKSGVTGAGRGLKQNMLMAEAGESVSPYAVGVHRHAPEIDQELSKISGKNIVVNFTPHLIPMSRGELITAHVKLDNGSNINDLRATLEKAYKDEPFIKLLDEGKMPATGHVRGSNFCHINVFEDRIKGRAIVIAVIDNLVKGSAGQALQNFNIAFGFDENAALQQMPLFP